MFEPQPWTARLTPEERQQVEALDSALRHLGRALHLRHEGAGDWSLRAREVRDYTRRMLEGSTAWTNRDRDRLTKLRDRTERAV